MLCKQQFVIELGWRSDHLVRKTVNRWNWVFFRLLEEFPLKSGKVPDGRGRRTDRRDANLINANCWRTSNELQTASVNCAEGELFKQSRTVFRKNARCAMFEKSTRTVHIEGILFSTMLWRVKTNWPRFRYWMNERRLPQNLPIQS